MTRPEIWQTGLPNNVKAERAIFTILILDGHRFAEVVDMLEARDFYEPPHEQVWQAMTNLYKQGIDIDVVSLDTELKKITQDPKPAYSVIIDCVNDYTPGNNLEKFIQEVKCKSLLRKIIRTTNDYMMNARLEDAQPIPLLANLEKELIEIVDSVKDDRPTDAHGILNEIRADIAQGQEHGWKGLGTGFQWLDNHTGGFIPTQCWILGAYTGVGKTFFILQLILNVLKQGAHVILFSTEMDRKMNMLRLLGNLAGLGTISILKNTLTEEEKEKLLDAEKQMDNFKRNLTIFDGVYSVDEIRLKAKKRKLKEGLDIIFIDFIQNLKGAENIYERMSNAALALQQLAQELKVTIVIASQVSQTSAGWMSKEAIEYKGAGEIAAVADVGIWINKVKEDRSARQVVLRKVRHGTPCKQLVRVSFPSGRIIDMGEAQEDDEGVSINDDGSVTNQLD